MGSDAGTAEMMGGSGRDISRAGAAADPTATLQDARFLDDASGEEALPRWGRITGAVRLDWLLIFKTLRHRM
jgi:hypothetical protein